MSNQITRLEQITKKFLELYKNSPTIWVRAPGRVDLMGSHTDYNHGFVMTMTIDRDTWIAATPNSSKIISIYSMNFDEYREINLNNLIPLPQNKKPLDWSDYIAGIAWVLKYYGYPVNGFKGVIHSNIPFGSGLSSSAALEMAISVLFESIDKYSIDSVELAKMGQKAENSYVGVNCGILDQYSSLMGKKDSAILLDCRSIEGQLTPISPKLGIVIGNTKSERNLIGTEYSDRRSQCEEGVKILKNYYPEINALRDVSMDKLLKHSTELPSVVYKRCRFIIEENQRVIELAKWLPKGDKKQIEELFISSFIGARDLFEIVNPAMESMFNAMSTGPGIVGVRQAGGGFGGCLIALVEKHFIESFIDHVIENYTIATGIYPDVFSIKPSGGAEIMT